MKPCSLFTVLLALLMAAALPQQSAAQQETQRHYRVEIIVVRHLAGSSDTAPQETLRDFSNILDLYAPPVEPITATVTSGTAQTDENATDPLLSEDELTGDELTEDEPLAVRIDDMSDTMRETWRRLRGSAGFRPELFRAWEQSGDSPFPQMRIHDEEVLFTIDPALQPPDVPLDEYGALVFSDATVQRKEDLDPLLDPLLQVEVEPEPIEYFYRIDGTATLTRSRFLHLDLDIELREPLYEHAGTAPPMVWAEEPVTTDSDSSNDSQANDSQAPIKSGAAASAPAFRIHQIQQRRQVSTEQMEYFDGPVIGVLALVTGFDVVAETAEPENLQP